MTRHRLTDEQETRLSEETRLFALRSRCEEFLGRSASPREGGAWGGGWGGKGRTGRSTRGRWRGEEGHRLPSAQHEGSRAGVRCAARRKRGRWAVGLSDAGGLRPAATGVFAEQACAEAAAGRAPRAGGVVVLRIREGRIGRLRRLGQELQQVGQLGRAAKQVGKSSETRPCVSGDCSSVAGD
jgi:hypothetical protein